MYGQPAAEFRPNRTFQILRSTDALVNQYAGRVYQIIDGDEVGVIGNPAIGSGGAPVAFFELSSIDVDFDPAGTFSFEPLNAYTRIYDVARRAFAKLGEFAPFLFSEQPQAPAAPEENWNATFAPGTIFQIKATVNPSLIPYQGMVFKSRQVGDYGVLAIPELTSGCEDPIFMPFDAETTFTLDPPGIYSFVEGVRPGARVYCIERATYVDVEELYPTFFGVVYVPQPFGVITISN